jgi:hypothetical protein
MIPETAPPGTRSRSKRVTLPPLTVIASAARPKPVRNGPEPSRGATAHSKKSIAGARGRGFRLRARCCALTQSTLGRGRCAAAARRRFDLHQVDHGRSPCRWSASCGHRRALTHASQSLEAMPLAWAGWPLSGILCAHELRSPPGRNDWRPLAGVRFGRWVPAREGAAHLPARGTPRERPRSRTGARLRGLLRWAASLHRLHGVRARGGLVRSRR